MAHWTRKCQECGSTQHDSYPPTATQSAYNKWAEHKCRKCKSISLDYGKEDTQIIVLDMDDGPEALHNTFLQIFGE